MIDRLTQPDEARAFLDWAFGRKPEGAFLLIWTLQDKKSRWFTSTNEAASAVDRLKDTHDVYVGVALAPNDYGPKERCKADETVGIVGLWADVDIADPVHKKLNLPPTLEKAMALLGEMGLPPSVVIHSGHGLQAWWLFKEPWLFDSSEERQKAQRLAEAWQNTLRAHAKRHGWDVDATHDLARVLRVPGTYNHKGSEPVPTGLLTDF